MLCPSDSIRDDEPCVQHLRCRLQRHNPLSADLGDMVIYGSKQGGAGGGNMASSSYAAVARVSRAASGPPCRVLRSNVLGLGSVQPGAHSPEDHHHGGSEKKGTQYAHRQ